MQGYTEQAMTAILKTDPSIDAAARTRIMRAMREAEARITGRPSDDAANGGVWRFKRVAGYLGISRRSVVNLCASGILSPVKLPGRKRCLGILGRDVIALAEGRTQAGA